MEGERTSGEPNDEHLSAERQVRISGRPDARDPEEFEPGWTYQRSLARLGESSLEEGVLSGPDSFQS